MYFFFEKKGLQRGKEEKGTFIPKDFYFWVFSFTQHSTNIDLASTVPEIDKDTIENE